MAVVAVENPHNNAPRKPGFPYRQLILKRILSPVSLKQQKPGINPSTPELNSSAQRCLTRFFTWDFAS
jgi:hypothetical protein